MPTRFYIHIGMHKTGSSSIQASFFNNRDRLLAHGINYLRIAANHSGSMYTLFSEEAHTYRPNLRRGADTPEKAAVRREAIRADLIRELQSNVSPKFVVSGEDLSRLRFAEVERLRSTLLPYSSQFTIIIYVREPYSFVSSAVQQRVKRGFTFDQIWKDPHLPNYRARIEPYIEAFGRENVDVRMFAPTALVGGDVVRDFAAAIGEPVTLIPAEESIRANVSLSHFGTMILEAANRLHPIEYREQSPNLGLVPLLEQIKGSKFVLPFDPGDEIKAKIAADVAWLNAFLGKVAFENEATLAPPVSLERETLRSLAEILGAVRQRRGTRKEGRRAGQGERQAFDTKAGLTKTPRRRRLRDVFAALFGGGTNEPRSF